MAEGKKFPRRFKERWATYPKCEHIIQEVWTREASRDSPMFRLLSKIRACRLAFVAWRRNIGSFTSGLVEKERMLEQLMAMNSVDNLEQIQIIKGEINAILYHEELFWRQRLRAI